MRMTSHIGTLVIKKKIYLTGCVLREFWTKMNKVQFTSPEKKKIGFPFNKKIPVNLMAVGHAFQAEA